MPQRQPQGMTDINITNVCVQDICAIAALEQLVFGEIIYPAFLFRQVFDCYADTFWVARLGHQVVGYLLAVPAHDGRLAIWSIAVGPQARGQGIGRLLLDKALGYAKAKRCAAWLTVDPANSAAQALYRAANMQCIAEEKHYYGENEHRQLWQFNDY
jgi:ribosomal protein S18 acetylase RimI-like enzyme